MILASNRGKCTIRGTEDLVAAHGIPPDLLARLLIVPAISYNPGEVKTIARLRARTEGLVISEAALQKVSEQGVKVSLRYALQLLTPASILARVAGRKEIDVIDVEECEDLFIDAKRSAAIVRQGNRFIS